MFFAGARYRHDRDKGRQKMNVFSTGKSQARFYERPDSRDMLKTEGMVQRVCAGQVQMDRFVRYEDAKDAIREEEPLTGTGVPVPQEDRAVREPVLSEVERCAGQFFDGSLPEDGLRAEYERLLGDYLRRVCAPGASAESQKAAADRFYDAFRQKVLDTAVQRNNAEGAQYITGEMNSQRSWKYYNSAYYFACEKAVAAITAGAENAAREQGFSFAVPDYKAEGLNLYYNFNSAWSNNFDASQQYITDYDAVPPEDFEWFFEQGGDSSRDVLTMDSLTIRNPDGTEEVIHYKTAAFDPTDPTKATTWVRYTATGGKEFFLRRDLRFNGSRDDLHTVSDLLKVSENDAGQTEPLTAFLNALQLYSNGYFSRISPSLFATNRGVDLRA